jgi:hypothetical protein
MAVALSAWPKFHAFDTNGNPLAFGKLYTYQAGTSTPFATYTDSTGSVPNPNPIILDSRGEANVWLLIGSAYKFTLNDSANALIWTVDNILATPQGTPALLAPSFTTVPGMQTTLDPGEIGSEVVPTSLEQQLQQIYHVLKEMKGTAQWYPSFTTRSESVSLGAQAAENTIWTPTGLTSYNFRWRVPDGWQGISTMTLRFMRRLNSGTGTAKMYWTYFRVRHNDAVNPSGNAQLDFTPGDLLCHETTLSIPGTNFLAGDYAVVSVSRQGDDVGDTATGTVVCDGFAFDYTGFASR